jgi:hypothetical protein
MKNAFLLLLAFFFFGCQKEELKNAERTASGVCGSSNPTQDLAWLKAEIEKSSVPNDYCTPSSVIQGVYQDKPVFIIPVSGALCCPCAGNQVYDCEGKLVFGCNLDEEANIQNKVVIWQKK